MQFLKKRMKQLNYYLDKIYLSDWFSPIHDKYLDWIVVPLDNIKRILAYIPILWKTREWDFYYTAQVWKFSLSRLEKGMREGHCIHGKKRLRKLKIAQNLLDRLSAGADFYENMKMNELYKKWGEPEIDFVPEGKSGAASYYKMIDRRTMRWTKKQNEQYKKEVRKTFEEAQKLRKRDIDLLCKILKTQANGWWD